MGFFDRFRKDKNVKENVIYTPPVTARQPYEFKTYPADGGMFIEMIDNNYEVGKYYDTTRIFIPDTTTMIGGTPLKECLVSWYGQDDCIRIDNDGEELGRRTDYRSVLAGINTELLNHDYKYCVALMRDLFKETRVLEYLKRGEQDSPEVPCGKYIGYVNELYQKAFNSSIGRTAHNTPEMQQKRLLLKQQAERARQNSIARKKEEIARLQGELNNLEGNSR